MRIKGLILWVAVMLLGTGEAIGQFYLSGQDPFGFKWEYIESGNGKVVFPSFLEETGERVTGYKQWLTPTITEGLADLTGNFPILIHPALLQSNGMVTYAPRRMELYSSPPVESYAQTWMRQLVPHEYRHVVQMANLDIGFTKALKVILGEAGPGLVTMLLSTWFYEGDATMVESRYAMFGRGRQPEFSIAYRAILNEQGTNSMSLTKMVLGSYKDYVPDAYAFGYQMVPAALHFYGEDFWDKVVRYTARNPYFLISPNIAYKKYFDTSTETLKERTFEYLRHKWSDASSVDNSSSFIETPITSYTQYSHPQFFDKGYVAAKYDRDNRTRIVSVDKSGVERELARAATISSRIVTEGDKIFWTEYTPSKFWTLKSYSNVRSITVDSLTGHASRPKTLIKDGNIFFFTPMGDRGYAYMEYDIANRPSIVVTDGDMNELKRISPKGEENSLNGMAWDKKSQTLAIILLDDKGMRLSRVDIEGGEIKDLTPPSYVTRKNLSAADGKLYFTSISSGKDEVHMYDLEQDREYRITSSKYGSFAGAAEGDSLVMLTYSIDGYLMAEQAIEADSLVEVEQTSLPKDILDPGFVDWDKYPKIDTMSLALHVDTASMESRKYRKAKHLYNPHSWIPLTIDPAEIVDESVFNINLGATVMSQNLLGTMTSTLGYGYVFENNMSLYQGSVSYMGLPVHFDFDFEYGGNYQGITTSTLRPYLGTIEKYASASLLASLPINLSTGSSLRSITTYAGISYYNDILFDPVVFDYFKGYSKTTVGVQLQNYRYLSIKDLAPRYGYVVDLSAALNPFDSNFGKAYNLYGSIFLPGLLPQHSTNIKGNIGYQDISYYNFTQKKLFPTGVDYSIPANYLYSTAAYYKFPIAYPDGGIPSLLYVRRIYMNLFGEYAHLRYISDGETYIQNPYTYGGQLLLDFNIMRIGIDLNAGVSVYKPSDRGTIVGAVFSFAI